jgi:23S rRNA (cytosine1962-C5)-methyltransferase
MDIPGVTMNPFDLVGEVEISANGNRRLRQGHLWVYSSDVVKEPVGDPPVFARVLDPGSKTVGYALYSGKSEIRLRLFSRDDQPPTPELLRKRLHESIERRRYRLVPGTACRLVFGEADILPSVVVDRYAEFVVLQTLSRGAEALKPVLVEMLEEEMRPAGIIERNDVKARLLEGLDESRGILAGRVPSEVEIQEEGVRFVVDLCSGQKTGFFLDQSENRAAAARYASGKALDCFTNTGAFALHFAGRCESVLAADTSEESLAVARRNAALNRFSHVEFREANAFDLLRELERAGARFDVVCLDPPAFAKNRKALAGALGGYKEINLRAMKLLNPDGVLVTSSCSYHLQEAMFYEVLQMAAHDARRYVQVLERRSQAADHPVLIGMPETHYLKCFILRVM